MIVLSTLLLIAVGCRVTGHVLHQPLSSDGSGNVTGGEVMYGSSPVQVTASHDKPALEEKPMLWHKDGKHHNRELQDVSLFETFEKVNNRLKEDYTEKELFKAYKRYYEAFLEAHQMASPPVKADSPQGVLCVIHPKTKEHIPVKTEHGIDKSTKRFIEVKGKRIPVHEQVGDNGAPEQMYAIIPGSGRVSVTRANEHNVDHEKDTPSPVVKNGSTADKGSKVQMSNNKDSGVFSEYTQHFTVGKGKHTKNAHPEKPTSLWNAGKANEDKDNYMGDVQHGSTIVDNDKPEKQLKDVYHIMNTPQPDESNSIEKDILTQKKNVYPGSTMVDNDIIKTPHTDDFDSTYGLTTNTQNANSGSIIEDNDEPDQPVENIYHITSAPNFDESDSTGRDIPENKGVYNEDKPFEGFIQPTNNAPNDEEPDSTYKYIEDRQKQAYPGLTIDDNKPEKRVIDVKNLTSTPNTDESDVLDKDVVPEKRIVSPPLTMDDIEKPKRPCSKFHSMPKPMFIGNEKSAREKNIRRGLNKFEKPKKTYGTGNHLNKINHFKKPAFTSKPRKSYGPIKSERNGVYLRSAFSETEKPRRMYGSAKRNKRFGHSKKSIIQKKRDSYGRMMTKLYETDEPSLGHWSYEPRYEQARTWETIITQTPEIYDYDKAMPVTGLWNADPRRHQPNSWKTIITEMSERKKYGGDNKVRRSNGLNTKYGNNPFITSSGGKSVEEGGMDQGRQRELGELHNRNVELMKLRKKAYEKQ